MPTESVINFRPGTSIVVIQVAPHRVIIRLAGLDNGWSKSSPYCHCLNMCSDLKLILPSKLFQTAEFPFQSPDLLNIQTYASMCMSLPSVQKFLGIAHISSSGALSYQLTMRTMKMSCAWWNTKPKRFSFWSETKILILTLPSLASTNHRCNYISVLWHCYSCAWFSRKHLHRNCWCRKRHSKLLWSRPGEQCFSKLFIDQNLFTFNWCNVS